MTMTYYEKNCSSGYQRKVMQILIRMKQMVRNET